MRNRVKTIHLCVCTAESDFYIIQEIFEDYKSLIGRWQSKNTEYNGQSGKGLSDKQWSIKHHT